MITLQRGVTLRVTGVRVSPLADMEYRITYAASGKCHSCSMVWSVRPLYEGEGLLFEDAVKAAIIDHQMATREHLVADFEVEV